jgi:tRNA(Ile)-lysidine synthase
MLDGPDGNVRPVFVFRGSLMPDRLEETVADFLHRQGLFAGAGGILLAVSGGADSVALLYVLTTLKARGRLEPNLVCAHINHQLRGPASDADEQFVVERAHQLGVPVVARTVDVRAHAQAHKLSLETAARQLRLANLAEIARGHGCTWVSTGHQKNDNAETVIHRLVRGTGFHGLAGIRPMRSFGDLRLASPLLCVTRSEIVQYLHRHDLRWREDQTNADLAYTRNYIRHKLLPLLQQEAQGCLVEELSDLAAAAARLHDRVERETEEAWTRLVQSTANEIIIDASGLARLPEPVAVELVRQALVRLAVGESDLTQTHYANILQVARKSVRGKRVALPHGFLARRESNQIIISAGQPARRVGLAPPPAAPTPLAVPGETQFAGHTIETRILHAARIAGDKGPFVEYLDLDQATPPLVVRPRRPGDRFQPLGMPAEKKVGKFLTTAKVPQELRDQILIFADREKIVWVCPVRLSERVKITEGTRRVLRLTVRRP